MVFAVVVCPFIFGKLEMLGCALYAHPTAIPMGKEQPRTYCAPCAHDLIHLCLYSGISWPCILRVAELEGLLIG